MSGTERPARIELMDALRGLAVCLMVLHHFLYDLLYFRTGISPHKTPSKPVSTPLEGAMI